ncbi:MAG: DNA translocase FtsK [Sphaerochaetaceae bacterium]|nr:DNA translocase FtsK [Candidatus Cloacimonadota bacterium]
MVALILAFVPLVVAALLLLPLFLSAALIDRLPFNLFFSDINTFLKDNAILSFSDSTAPLIIAACVLVVVALLIIVSSKKPLYWWVAPYFVLLYYTVYLFFQLLYKQNTPVFLIEKLNKEPLMALILVILLFLLELLLAVVFFIITKKMSRLFKKREPKGKNKKRVVKEQQREEKGEKRESSVELDSFGFPIVSQLPKLRTIRNIDEEDQIYVGSVKEQEDSSLIIAETPTEDPIPTLRQQMQKDARLASLISRPFVKSEKKRETFEVEKPKEILKEVPVITPTVKTEVIQEVADNQDIDIISGVGGLISSTGHDALLSRSKITYKFPPEELLDTYPDHVNHIDAHTKAAGEDLVATLKQFKIEAELINIVKGPTVTMFEVSPAPGVRVSSILSLSDNIALRLAARQIRIVAPIPGKQAVGIEVPNKERSIIGFRDLLSSIDEKTYQVPMILGRKITGEPVVIELTQTPHLLIAGATGSGKSVCVNSLISSILYRRSPKEVRLILVDPKIVELRVYNNIPHLLTPVITEPKKTIKALEFCLYEMERRYKLLNGLAVRNISAYNKKVADQKIAREKLPYIVVVIDEFADLMTTVGKELETLLARLAAMARAVGIHLVLATQRPSANVITGIIKSNIPTRIAFMVASQIDSRIIIDETGAEKLLGRGDMLFAPGWDPASVRIQGSFLSDEEVERVVEFAKQQGEPDYLDESFFEDEPESEEDENDFDNDTSDEALMEKALKIVVERNGASASYLQRRLKIGYNRAARLVEQMEEEGLVGPQRGSKPRELLRLPQ